MLKINPNPQCKSCTHFHFVSIDGYSGLVGMHFLCRIPIEATIEGYTALYPIYEDAVIDQFFGGIGECDYYQEEQNEQPYL